MINLVELVNNTIFLDSVRKAKQSKSEKDIATDLGLTTIELRKKISKIHRDNREFLKEFAELLKRDGKTVEEISLILGRTESTVRLLLDDDLNRNYVKAGELKRA